MVHQNYPGSFLGLLTPTCTARVMIQGVSDEAQEPAQLTSAPRGSCVECQDLTVRNISSLKKVIAIVKRIQKRAQRLFMDRKIV